MDVFTAAINGAAPKPSPNAMLLEKAGKEILEHLRQGTYRGFGFDRPRSMETIPVAIPKEAWSTNSLHPNNELKFQSLKFVDVRIRMVPASTDPLLANVGDRHAPQVGRPSLKKPIIQAFDALLRNGAINIDAPLKSIWPKIRQNLYETKAALPKPVAELSDETFRRYLSPEIKRLRKSKKQ